MCTKVRRVIYSVDQGVASCLQCGPRCDELFTVYTKVWRVVYSVDQGLESLFTVLAKVRGVVYNVNQCVASCLQCGPRCGELFTV